MKKNFNDDFEIEKTKFISKSYISKFLNYYYGVYCYLFNIKICNERL